MISEDKIADACNKAYLQAGHNAYFGNGFQKGVEFAITHLQSQNAELLQGLLTAYHRK